MTAILRSKLCKAAHAHMCIWCGETINKGEQYLNEAVAYEGRLETQKWHPECKEDANDKFDDDGTFQPHQNERPRE